MSWRDSFRCTDNQQAFIFLRIAVLLLVTHLSSCRTMASEDGFYPFDTFVSSAFGKSYSVVVSKESLSAMPKWLNSADSPPVPPRAAIRSAGALADRLIGERSEYQRYLEGITLKPIEGGWVWVVRFDWISMRSASGIPDHLIVVIPMDGKPINPKVSPLAKE